MKTRASRKSVEMNPALAVALLGWRGSTLYPQDSDWVFASPYTNGKQPYWPESALKGPRPSGGDRGWHHKDDRVAHLPPFSGEFAGPASRARA
jgi:hypothetical protein